MVNGAAGGVGHFVVQLAKWKDAYVIAVASEKNESILHELSADKFIDYTKENADEIVSEVDFVVDCFDGPATGRFLKTLKKGGALFPIFS